MMRVLCSSWLLPALLVLPAAGQNERQVEEEMEFARELAQRFSYVDLAERVISSLEEAQLSERQSEALGLLQSEVYAAGARREPDPERRQELFEKALQSFRDYMEGHPYSEFLEDARASYVDLANTYGRTLEEELQEAVGEEAQALRERVSEVLEEAVGMTEEVLETRYAGELSQTEKLERWRLMLNQGQMLLTLGNVSEAGTFYFAEAEELLQKLAFEAGETSAAGLNAYLLSARVYMAQGEWQTAADYAEYVVLTIAVPLDPQMREQTGWNEAGYEEKTQRFRLAELGLPYLVDSYLALGKVPAAVEAALHVYNIWRIEGFDLTPFGHLALLSTARALLESDGWVGGTQREGNLRWFPTREEMEEAGFRPPREGQSALDLALKIAQDVNEENRGNVIQLQAQRLISEATSRPGVEVSPDVLFEAAQGEYLAKEYEEALRAFKDLMRRMESQDEATRQQYAPKVLYHVGSTLLKEDRDIEAAMAFREGATRWAGDPEYQERLAQGYYAATRRVRADAPDDPLLERLYLEAEDLYSRALESEADKGNLLFRQAERAYEEGDFTRAREVYRQVEEGSAQYEKARVKAALTLYKQQDFDAAREEFASYLEQYVTDPRTKPVDATKRRVRDEAMAMATFYLGLMAYRAQEYDEVLERLAGFPERFPGQDDYSANALFMVVMAHLARGELDLAREVHAKMNEALPEHERTGIAAAQIYDALKQEQEAAAAAGDEERARELEVRMAEAMHLANELDSEPNYSNLRTESILWLELGRWSEAEQALRALVNVFGDDPAHADSVEAHVLPDLGLALLEQKRVPEAFQVLDPLMPRGKGEKPSPELARRWSRAVTGWVEEQDGEIVEVPGVGGAENFDLAARTLIQLTNQVKHTEGDWTCPWYELKFRTAYAYYQWGELESPRRETAHDVVEQLMDIAADPRLELIAEECGDDTLRQRFLWLWEKLR